VLDIISQPVPVELDLKITQTSVEAAA
jgi:hypothetical protein